MGRPKGTFKLEADKFMSQRELGAFLHAAAHIEKNKTAYALFVLQYLLGMRVGEAVQLRYDHLGPLDKKGLPIYVNVPTLKTRNVAKDQVMTLSVPILGSPKLVLWCFEAKWRESAPERRSPFLFPSPRNASVAMSTKTAIAWFHSIASWARLRPSYTPHTLRHTAASQLYDKTGGKTRSITAFLRHKPGSMNSGQEAGSAAVTNRYIHVSMESWSRFRGVLDLPPLEPLFK